MGSSCFHGKKKIDNQMNEAFDSQFIGDNNVCSLLIDKLPFTLKIAKVFSKCTFE